MQPINKPPLKLLFGMGEDSEFVDGIQTTVRVGVKWRDLVGTRRLKNVPVFITGEQNEIGRAEITGTLFGQFRELAPIGSKFNNRKKSRTVEGLAEKLATVYPDFDPETSQVTVVFFKFTANEVELKNQAGEVIDGDTEVAGESPTETVEETEESDDDKENDSGEEVSDEETSDEETDGSSEESSAKESD